jgi:hypothetical protein
MILMRLIIDCARGAPFKEVLFIITSALRSNDPGSYSVLKCSTNLFFVCKKSHVSSVFSELNSPVGTYAVSNLAQSDILKFHLSFNKAHNFKGVKCGPCLLFLYAVWKFHKTQLNLDLSVQPALLL